MAQISCLRSLSPCNQGLTPVCSILCIWVEHGLKFQTGDSSKRIDIYEGKRSFSLWQKKGGKYPAASPKLSIENEDFLLELSCTYFISMTGQVPGPFGCIKMTGTLTMLYSVCW